MIDLNKPIADLLKSISKVELSFPSVTSTFPLITLTEVANRSSLVLDGEERLSNIEFQIDVWDTSDDGNTRERCEQIAAQVNDVLLSKGFKRESAAKINDPSGLHRKMMTFSAIVDNKNFNVYGSEY